MFSSRILIQIKLNRNQRANIWRKILFYCCNAAAKQHFHVNTMATATIAIHTHSRYGEPGQGLWWLCQSTASFSIQAFMCISKLFIKSEWFLLKKKYNKVALIEMWSVEKSKEPVTRHGRKIILMKAWESRAWAWCWPCVSPLWLTPLEVG